MCVPPGPAVILIMGVPLPPFSFVLRPFLSVGVPNTAEHTYLAVLGISIEESTESRACAATSLFPATAAGGCEVLFPQMGKPL